MARIETREQAENFVEFAAELEKALSAAESALKRDVAGMMKKTAYWKDDRRSAEEIAETLAERFWSFDRRVLEMEMKDFFDYLDAMPEDDSSEMYQYLSDVLG